MNSSRVIGVFSDVGICVVRKAGLIVEREKLVSIDLVSGIREMDRITETNVSNFVIIHGVRANLVVKQLSIINDGLVLISSPILHVSMDVSFDRSNGNFRASWSVVFYVVIWFRRIGSNSCIYLNMAISFTIGVISSR